jgi:AmiR/NasT family two-component response regulator
MRPMRKMMIQDRAPRWRVAVLEGDPVSRARLRAAVEDAGGEVAIEAPLRLDAAALMQETRPDILILAPDLWGPGEPALMPRITAGLECAAVLYTRDTAPALMRQANRAGVMGFLLKPLRGVELGPTLDLALARFRDLRRLRRARSERPVVDRARDKLMSDWRIGEAEAYGWLRRRAMDSRRRISDVAHAVLAGQVAARDTVAAGPRQ